MKSAVMGLSMVVALSIRALPLIAAEFYKLEGIKRIDQNLYRSGKILVVTRYCYHYTYGETAILKYEGSSEFSGSVIIWEDNSTCEVSKIVSE
jgi:hypothetical protein